MDDVEAEFFRKSQQRQRSTEIQAEAATAKVYASSSDEDAIYKKNKFWAFLFCFITLGTLGGLFMLAGLYGMASQDSAEQTQGRGYLRGSILGSILGWVALFIVGILFSISQRH